MPALNIKPTQKPIKQYYAELKEYARIGAAHEGTVRNAFQTLLQHYCRQADLLLVCENAIYIEENGRVITLDGEVVDAFKLTHGHWEAKDTQDDLYAEAAKKLARGYPSKNIIFQSPERALLYQDGQLVLDVDITDRRNIVLLLQTFLAYQEENISAWHTAFADFKETVLQLGEQLAALIETEQQNNPHFQEAFVHFHQQCKALINPNLSIAAVEEMLILHLLTERIFATVFKNPDFIHRNIIVAEIEKVIHVLTEHALNRDQFLQSLEPFYVALEKTASTFNFWPKQGFLDTVYEQFFQDFFIKVADTHGIVYTPQPIVDFMVQSVEHLLRTVFSASFSDTEVHIIDPFVGTGNFIGRIIQYIRPSMREEKYKSELHCNALLLLPYYIASLNIEHTYFQRKGTYRPFEGITLADTFELLEEQQVQLFTRENTERVERQKAADMFVVIGNPPYNAGQVNENDNNKNWKYETMDKRVRETYSQDSKTTNKNALSDPYVKAIRWALDRIGEEGVVVFVTNNSFFDGVAFDGMRKHLAADCHAIYILDLGGNVQKGLKVSDANVFGIRVGVSINLFVKKRENSSGPPHLFYYCTDEMWNKQQKFEFLTARRDIGTIEWESIQPDARHTWLTQEIHDEFDTFIPMRTKVAKETKETAVGAIFGTYSLGVSTCRSAWTYNFNRNTLIGNVQRVIETYNADVARWTQQADRHTNVDDFVVYDDTKNEWSRDLKLRLKRGTTAEYAAHKVRTDLYRPFTKSNLYFDRMSCDGVGVFPSIFPTVASEKENRVICVRCSYSNKLFHALNKPFHALMINVIPCLGMLDANQCFPFYTYDEDGTNRQENITDWALAQFRTHYRDETLTKWDIFYYTYGLLHHPDYSEDYSEKYQANLRPELPHIPFAEDFWGFAKAGAQLAELHVNYEAQPEYEKLELSPAPDVPLNWRVEKMKLSKDKTSLVYNDFLTLDGIPPKAFEYRLGTRSALEWVIDQYRVKTDTRSGIVNDPNRTDDPQYIVKLIRKVLTVSLGTVDIVNKLPAL